MAISAATDPYALEGRIATMAAAGVTERGRVCIRGGVIADVGESGQPPPDGFARAPLVKIGGTLFPGLIELHNHLSSNVMLLWDAPKRYAHSGSWQGTNPCKAAITKPSGQRVQGFLRKLGITRDDLMVNTVLYPISGQFPQVRDLSRSGPIQGFRATLLDRIAQENPREAVIAVGAAGADAVERWANHPTIPECEITHPSARDHAPLLANWNAGLVMLNGKVSPELGVAAHPAPCGSDWSAADEAPIPPRDLPFGVPEWHGVGSHASRGRREDGTTDPNASLWRAP